MVNLHSYSEVEALCVMRPCVVPVACGQLSGVLASGCFAGEERVTCAVPGGDASDAAVSVTMSDFLAHAGGGGAGAGAGAGESALWRTAVTFAGPGAESGDRAEPIGAWLQRRGAQWGKPAVGRVLPDNSIFS